MRSERRETDADEEEGPGGGLALLGKVVMTLAPFLLLALLVAGLMLLD